MLDCLIIGAGPAGLTAAVYLARYRRSVLVVHDGTSRALRIPLAHNVPGFTDGVVGRDLVDAMQRQAEKYGARIAHNRIGDVRRDGDGFLISGETEDYQARTLILATGVSVNEVDLPRDVHEAAIAAGCLRYCPICDGYEATGKAVGVLGSDNHGAAEALFLKQYTDRVTLLPRRNVDLSSDHRRQLDEAGVKIVEHAVAALRPGDSSMSVVIEGGDALEFDVLYPALGCQPRSELADRLGSNLSEDGGVNTDQSQRTSVRGVFAVGDLVEGLDQVSVAIGHGAVAATKVHNLLREIDGETLS